MAGIRPVIDSGKANPSEESRDHVIWEEDGLLTVTGGKLTTFRIIALDTLKKAQQLIGPLPDLTVKQAIFDNPVDFTRSQQDNVSAETVKRLSGRFGRDAETLLSESPREELETIPEIKTVWAELGWTARREMVVHLDDLMLRRTRIGLLLQKGGEAYLPAIRQRCQAILGWNDLHWEEEVRRYLAIWQNHYSVPGH
jgi:glycerol-3-phosphate dehydrogenase